MNDIPTPSENRDFPRIYSIGRRIDMLCRKWYNNRKSEWLKNVSTELKAFWNILRLEYLAYMRMAVQITKYINFFFLQRNFPYTDGVLMRIFNVQFSSYKVKARKINISCFPTNLFSAVIEADFSEWNGID